MSFDLGVPNDLDKNKKQTKNNELLPPEDARGPIQSFEENKGK